MTPPKKGQRKQKAVNELAKELHALKDDLQRCIEQFSIEINAQLADMIDALDGKEMIDGKSPRLPRYTELLELVKDVKRLKRKPKKGRVKDLVNAKKLITRLHDSFIQVR